MTIHTTSLPPDSSCAAYRILRTARIVSRSSIIARATWKLPLLTLKLHTHVLGSRVEAHWVLGANFLKIGILWVGGIWVLSEIELCSISTLKPSTNEGSRTMDTVLSQMHGRRLRIAIRVCVSQDLLGR